MERSFCFVEKQVDMLSQLVKHSLVKLDILLECPSLSDTSRLSSSDDVCKVISGLSSCKMVYTLSECCISSVDDVLSHFKLNK